MSYVLQVEMMMNKFPLAYNAVTDQYFKSILNLVGRSTDLHDLLTDKRSCPVMKCPLRTDSEGNASDCYKDECAWWVADAEIEGSKEIGACTVLEIAVNGIFVTIGDDEEEGYN